MQTARTMTRLTTWTRVRKIGDIYIGFVYFSDFLDVHMTSPPTSPSRNLQGASRTTGGFSRGRAMGNTFNYADASDIQMDLDLALSIPAKVYLYESLNNSSQVD